jgi:hypothetical protein
VLAARRDRLPNDDDVRNLLEAPANDPVRLEEQLLRHADFAAAVDFDWSEGGAT